MSCLDISNLSNLCKLPFIMNEDPHKARRVHNGSKTKEILQKERKKEKTKIIRNQLNVEKGCHSASCNCSYPYYNHNCIEPNHGRRKLFMKRTSTKNNHVYHVLMQARQ